jgi:hypothetical protein
MTKSSPSHLIATCRRYSMLPFTAAFPCIFPSHRRARLLADAIHHFVLLRSPGFVPRSRPAGVQPVSSRCPAGAQPVSGRSCDFWGDLRPMNRRDGRQGTKRFRRSGSLLALAVLDGYARAAVTERHGTHCCMRSLADRTTRQECRHPAQMYNPGLGWRSPAFAEESRIPVREAEPRAAQRKVRDTWRTNDDDAAAACRAFFGRRSPPSPIVR